VRRPTKRGLIFGYGAIHEDDIPEGLTHLHRAMRIVNANLQIVYPPWLGARETSRAAGSPATAGIFLRERGSGMNDDLRAFLAA
jgi:hypothetical protein